MSRVLLKKIRIVNLGPIKEDELILEPFTYFVGRNNAGKSHYLRAIELLLTTGTKKEEIAKLQHDKTKPIIIEGDFKGVQDFTNLVTTSNHKAAIEKSIKDGVLKVVTMLDSESGSRLGVYADDGNIHNPTGFSGNLLKVLPEIIFIQATADTVKELEDKTTTALGKLKKEVMSAFFQELAQKTGEVLTDLDEFLHSPDMNKRSQTIIDFETGLRDEFVGEFAGITTAVEFDLPTEQVIGKGMKILLDDGHKSEVEQKGHGLQRATLLALLRLLAKKGERYQNKPAPIFLIGELESFLHPFAQREMAYALNKMMVQYQIVTTTHSPFIILPQFVEGYRRVCKTLKEGSKAITPHKQNISIDSVKSHLEHRGNLEGLFADRVILTEGKHDEGFYDKIRQIFKIPLPDRKFTIFVKSNGKEQLRQARRFYQQMCLDDVSVICDLDYLFSNNFKHLLSDLGIKEEYPKQFREHIEWIEEGDPPLNIIIQKLKEKGEPANFEQLLNKLQEKRIFVLRHGNPEKYYKKRTGQKSGWTNIQSKDDLCEPDYLCKLITEVLKNKLLS